MGDAATLLNPEYQQRANQHIGGAAAFAAGFNPLVGTITGIYGAITGTDLSGGQQLGTTDRVLGVVPFGRIAKVLKSAKVSATPKSLVHNSGGQWNNGRQYGVVFSLELDPNLFVNKRGVHFEAANEALYNAMKADPRLERQIKAPTQTYGSTCSRIVVGSLAPSHRLMPGSLGIMP